ncbi:ketoacyl-ACP synthase III [Streptomyces sp. WAC 01529]|uniref:3-oxoacyl-ACP synthase III family protein n=1 Tax=unclassified Streptomyces TaxID=2593676 RepID=UPI000996E9EA|nr:MULTISPECIES: ketoacyl-ACP synthase III [unclassified Streptomyces]AZM57356.1 ketoacyl-ACP synthase III [Streptomyces sp. WAC 01529]
MTTAARTGASTGPDGGSGLGVVALASYLPGEPVTNDSVGAAIGVDLKWIQDRIGIRTRHHAAPHEHTSDLATRVARRVAEHSPVGPDLIVLATVTPDRPVPATACLVQDRLGLPGTPALDINAACAGFIYALVTAAGTVAVGAARTPLVIGADVFTRFVDPTDRRTAPLFGDGAGAVQLGPVPEGYGILATELWADGSQASYATVPPAGEGWFEMNGRGVSEVVLEMGPKVLGTALTKAGIRLDQLNRVIVHQANPRLVGTLAESVGLDDRIVPRYGVQTGNTAAASIPIALVMAHEEQPFRRGDLVALVAVGAGMTAGAAVLRWY